MHGIQELSHTKEEGTWRGAANEHSGSAITLEEPKEMTSLRDIGFMEVSLFEHPFSFREDVAAREAYREVLRFLPLGMQREILRIERSHMHFVERLNEIRIRQNGVSTLLLSTTRVALSYRLQREEAREMLRSMTHGALYAFRSQMRRGYLTDRKSVV